MFSPNPEKAQEPVVLLPGWNFLLVLKANPKGVAAPTAPGGRLDGHTRRTVLLSKAVRWRATDEVKVAFNHDPHSGTPAKYFAGTEGEFLLNDKMETVSFTADGKQSVTLYLEIE